MLTPPVLIATKLQPPRVREQAIARDHLLERLNRGSGLKLTLVACPAGYGKTGLLAAWREVEATQKPVGWVTLDERDEDPVVLWSYAIEALRRVCPDLGPSASPERVGAAPLTEEVLPQLLNDLEGRGEMALILDDFHRLRSGPACDSVAWFIEHAPSTFQLVLATRTEPPFPLGALRAHGELLDLRAEDLRFSSHEAAVFLNRRLDLGLAEQDVDDLVARTDGWPAGLYLAALSLEKAADRHALVQRFGASNRHVVDYLIAEVLEAHDPPMQSLMLHSSILGRMSGALCDAVMKQRGSAAKLDALSRTNLFLTPLDDEGEWYRFHHLFEQLLRVELQRHAPDLVPTLHRRASAWHRKHGTIDEAIHHALEAGAFAEAAELVESSWAEYANSCRYATVLAWLRRFPDEVLGFDARLLLAKAWVLSLCAKQEEAANVITRIEQLGQLSEGPLPDGFRSVEGSLATLKAVLPWGDVAAQLENGLRAIELESAESPWRPVGLFAVGMAFYYRGEIEEADRRFKETAALAPASEQWIVAGASLAYRSLIAGERARLDEQRLLADDAARVAREHDVEEADGEVSVAQGMSLAARGRPEEGLQFTERGVGFLRSWGQPIELANALLCQAKMLRTLGSRLRLAAVVSEARSIIESCSDPGNLSERLAALERPPERITEGNHEVTTAEFRVLRLLGAGLTEREIGKELYLSRNTVHSHIRSIYRKLDATSRAGAIAAACALGLLQL